MSENGLKLLSARALGLTVYGLREYVSLISNGFRSPLQKSRPDATGAMWVYNFKKHGRDAAGVEKLVREAATQLACVQVVVIPSSSVELNRLQLLFGATILRIVPVASRKRDHKNALPRNYAESWTCDFSSMKGKRVMLLDDIASSLATMKHFYNALKNAGVEPVPFALGLNFKLCPKQFENTDTVKPAGAGVKRTTGANELSFLLDNDEDKPTATAKVFKPMVPTAKPSKAPPEPINDLKRAFLERASIENRRYALAVDSEFWFCVCFLSREQKDAFLAQTRLVIHGDKYIDGKHLAKLCGVQLPACAPLQKLKPPAKPMIPLVTETFENE